MINEDSKLFEFEVKETFNEMARFGEIPKSKSGYEIHIEGKEGEIPSIHICKGNGKNIICHISLIDNRYIRDNYEINGNRITLNSSERKALDDFLKTITSGNTVTNWELCFMSWNVQNPLYAKDIKEYQRPTYLEIKEDKKITGGF